MSELILGNMNYSSWSIRAALVARASGLEIPETIVPLGFDATRASLVERTGHHTVPVLLASGLIIRDSLAIAEWIGEQAEAGRVWPSDPAKRALARAVVAEMHSGFLQIRSKMPVDIRSRKPGPDLDEAMQAEIDRVLAIWTDCRAKSDQDGRFLFGAWSAADAFYAPVVTRFRTYGYDLTGAAADYADAVWESGLLQQLRQQAEAEPWEIEMGVLGPARAWLRE